MAHENTAPRVGCMQWHNATDSVTSGEADSLLVSFNLLNVHAKWFISLNCPGQVGRMFTYLSPLLYIT